MNFGEYLKKLRETRKMTLRKLASSSGVSHTYLSQVENGRRGIPKPEILRKLAEALKADYVEMLRVAGYLNEQENEKEITLEEALQQLFNSPFVMFNGLPVGELDEETKEDLLVIVRAVLEHRARQKAAQQEPPAKPAKKAAAAAEKSARARRSALPLAAAV